MEELIIGSHVSYKKEEGLLGSVKEALSYGANTFMFYTGAPQNTSRSPIDKDNVTEAFSLMKEEGIDPNHVIVHAPYIVNLANDTKNYDFAINFLKEEIKRVDALHMKYLILHPGSHVGVGVEKGISNIVFALNVALKESDNVIICLETMAGKGSEIGSSFEELKQIIDGVIKKEQVMVCLDTCHIHDAGYQVDDFNAILDQFDKIIGLSKLACIHVNDSKNILGAHKDRHANIGFGNIGFDNLLAIIYHPKLKGIPKILETPYIPDDHDKNRSYPPYKFELEMIKSKNINSQLMSDVQNYYRNF